MMKNNNYFYAHYKKARNKTWDVLLDCKISSLPVDLWEITEHYHFIIQFYSKSPLLDIMNEDIKKGDGFSTIINGTKMIFINDKKGTLQRRRFTVAHELGHCLLDHPLDEIQFRNDENTSEESVFEYEANIFARDLLMPAIVLAKLNVHTSEQIMQLCNVSKTAAEIRMERLKVLYQREQKFYEQRNYSCFGVHKKEDELQKQFSDFIKKKKNKTMDTKTQKWIPGTQLFTTAYSILNTLKPGETEKFICPLCAGTAYCGKASNGHERILCSTCKTSLIV